MWNPGSKVKHKIHLESLIGKHKETAFVEVRTT